MKNKVGCDYITTMAGNLNFISKRADFLTLEHLFLTFEQKCVMLISTEVVGHYRLWRYQNSTCT